MAILQLRLITLRGLNCLERSGYLSYSTEETPESNQISLFGKFSFGITSLRISSKRYFFLFCLVPNIRKVPEHSALFSVLTEISYFSGIFYYPISDLFWNIVKVDACDT
jgi:hypothetical protein